MLMLHVRPAGLTGGLMLTPLLAPAGKLQGWIFTDLLTDPGVHANRCGGHCAAAAFRCADRLRRARRHCRRLSQIALSGEPSSDTRAGLRPPRSGRSGRCPAIREPPHDPPRLGSAGYTLRAARRFAVMRDRQGDEIAGRRRRALSRRQGRRRTAGTKQARDDTRLAWHRQACGGSAQGRPGEAGACGDDG